MSSSLASGFGTDQPSVGRGLGVTDYDAPASFHEMSKDERRLLMFGPPNMAVTSVPHDRFARTNQIRQFEWAYAGSNQRITSVLIKKITNLDDFPARILLPIAPLPQGGVVNITQMEFNETLLDDVPEQGVGRLVTQQFSKWEMRMKRKGLMFMMEDGYAMTDAGVMSYLASLVQISNATIDTMNLDVYFKLLTAGSMSKNIYDLMGLDYRASRSDLFQNDFDMWAILNKTDFGFWHMLSTGRKVLQGRGVDADALVLPNGTRDYMKMNREETRNYSSVGPAGPAAFMDKNSYIQTQSGINIFESRMYRTDGNRAEDPLVRSRSIGEFFLMQHKLNCESVSAKDYRSSMRTISVHDNVSDTFVDIPLKTAIRYSGLFHNTPAATLSEELGRPYFSGYGTVGNYLNKFGVLDYVTEGILWNSQTKQSPTAGAEWDALVTRTTPAAAADKRIITQPTNGRPFNNMGIASSTSSRTNGGYNTAQMVTYSITKADLAAGFAGMRPELLTAVAQSQSTNNQETAHLFRAYIGEEKGVSDRSVWTRELVARFNSALDDAYASGSVKEVLAKPWVQTLRVMFGLESEQIRLYDLFESGSNIPAAFLDNLFGSSPSLRNYTTRGSYSYYATRTEEQPMELLASDRKAFENNKRLFSVKYAKVNQVLPNFLAGAYVMLVKAGNTVAGARKTIEESLYPLAAHIEMVISMRPTGQVLSTDEAKAAPTEGDDALIRKLQDVESAADVKLVVDWVKDNKRFFTQTQTEKKTAVVSLKVGGGEIVGPLTTGLGDPQKAVVAALMAMSIKHMGLFVNFCYKHNVMVPIDFMAARNSMEYEMGSAILMKAGRETGLSYFGEADFLLGNDVDRKMLKGFFTCWLGSAVHKPRNVFILNNITCVQYLRGGGVKPFDPLDPNHRNDYQMGLTNGNDMFFIPLDLDEQINNTVIDLTGYFPDELNGNGSMRPHFRMAKSFSALWLLTHRENYWDVSFFQIPQNAVNTVCCTGHQFMPMFKGAAGIEPRGYYRSGKGHWGPDVYEGARAERCGKGRGFVQKQDWARISKPI